MKNAAKNFDILILSNQFECHTYTELFFYLAKFQIFQQNLF